MVFNSESYKEKINNFFQKSSTGTIILQLLQNNEFSFLVYNFGVFITMLIILFCIMQFGHFIGKSLFSIEDDDDNAMPIE